MSAPGMCKAAPVRGARARQRGHHRRRCILAFAVVVVGRGVAVGASPCRRRPFPAAGAAAFAAPSRPLTLYEEMDEMNKAAQMAYLLADVRKLSCKIPESGSACKILANSQVDAHSSAESLRADSAVMKHGVGTGQLLEIIEGNYDVFKRELSGFEEGGKYEVALEALRSINARGEGDNNVVLEEFDDEMEDRRLVYCVARDRYRKRITVMVRGSVSEGTKDWKRNFQWGCAKMETPDWMIPLMRKRRKKLSVHQGFYEYLFENEDIKGMSQVRQRIDEIRDNVVVPLIMANKGYKIYITGHSLGGALATLIAFRAASVTKYDIPLPINLVTFASPYVGCSDFREAFQILEREGRIRHLRVTNHKDGVSTLFPFTPTLKFYKHVGMNLKLFPEKNKVEIRYPKVGSGPVDELCRGWKNSVLYNLGTAEGARVAHSTMEISRRIELQKELLCGDEPLMLNDLYRDENVVGKLGCKLGEA